MSDLVAGPETDLAIAKVLGWRELGTPGTGPAWSMEPLRGAWTVGDIGKLCYVYGRRIVGAERWHPSSDAAQALEALEAWCAERGRMADLTCGGRDWWTVDVGGIETAGPLPLAICAAILKANEPKRSGVEFELRIDPGRGLVDYGGGATGSRTVAGSVAIETPPSCTRGSIAEFEACAAEGHKRCREDA